MDAHCQLKHIELYVLWQNGAERDIKELKKGSGYKMFATGASSCHWDDCLELEAYICCHIINCVYCIDGKVYKMYMSGETTGISQFCELAWYDWIMYIPGTIDYLDEPLCLGKYLGLAIDVGPVITTKILQHNGKVVYRSMY